MILSIVILIAGSIVRSIGPNILLCHWTYTLEKLGRQSKKYLLLQENKILLGPDDYCCWHKT